MTENELIQILIENGASSLVVIVAILTWARSQYAGFRDQLIKDLRAGIQDDLSTLESHVKAELSSHGERLEDTADEVVEIRKDLDSLTARKREHSDQLERARTRIARLEGKLGITDSTPP